MEVEDILELQSWISAVTEEQSGGILAALLLAWDHPWKADVSKAVELITNLQV